MLPKMSASFQEIYSTAQTGESYSALHHTAQRSQNVTYVTTFKPKLLLKLKVVNKKATITAIRITC